MWPRERFRYLTGKSTLPQFLTFDTSKGSVADAENLTCTCKASNAARNKHVACC